MDDFLTVSDTQKALKKRMRRLGIRESDITEKFVTSGGKGGQNVNKVATCVQLSHIPSGIEIRVRQERSQAQNRVIARNRLCDKFEERVLTRKSEEKKEIEKIRRRKRARNRASKEKVLREKHFRASKKEMRKPVRND